MSFHMIQQFSPKCERFGAVFARKGFFTAMDLFMDGQRLPLLELFAAYFANITTHGAMQVHVLLHMSPFAEQFAAHVTLELFDAHMHDDDVPLQQTLGGERFAAMTARRIAAGVPSLMAYELLHTVTPVRARFALKVPRLISEHDAFRQKFQILFAERHLRRGRQRMHDGRSGERVRVHHAHV